ncbi:MAG: tetratricopeptide repeat protein [Pseudomonadota bacterium]
MLKTVRYLAAAALVAVCGIAQADNFCGELANHYGPYDYRKRGQVNLEIVEHAHFTADVEKGIRGATSDMGIGADLDYTLRAIPNHHRALATLTRVAIRDRIVTVPHTKWPVECYLDRAQRFAPDDGMVWATYGGYLFAVGRSDDAMAKFKQAYILEPENATINYNLGLLYLKNKDYDNALKHAEKAYAMKFPLPGLKNKLVEAGKWRPRQPDAAPATPAPETAPATPAAEAPAAPEATPPAAAPTPRP